MIRFYDCIVVGLQPAGLITAALLTKRGFNVAVVDHNELPCSYEEKGRRFPLAPSLTPNLHQSDIVRSIHQELGCSSLFQEQAKANHFQAVLSKNRLDIRPTTAELIKEFHKELPNEAPIAQLFLEHLENLQADISNYLGHFPPLPPYTMRERWSQRGSWANQFPHLNESFWESELYHLLPPDTPLSRLLLSPLSFMGYLPQKGLSLLQAARLLYHAFQGILTFETPIDEPVTSLVRMVEQQGATVYHNVGVREFFVKHRRVFQCTLRNGDTLTGGFFISNFAGSLADLFPTQRQMERYAENEETLQPSGTLLSLNIVVNNEVIPEGMATTLLLLNGRQRPRNDFPPDPPIVVRQYPAPRAPDAELPTANSAQTILTVACPVALSALASKSQLDKFSLQILKRLERLIPFLSDHIEFTSNPLEHLASSNSSGTPNGAWNVHPIFASTTPQQLGIASRGIQTPFKNCFRAGRDILPGLGLEGEYLSGLAIADKVAQLLVNRTNDPIT